jgi:hypothetical protein
MPAISRMLRIQPEGAEAGVTPASGETFRPVESRMARRVERAAAGKDLAGRGAMEAYRAGTMTLSRAAVGKCGDREDLAAVRTRDRAARRFPLLAAVSAFARFVRDMMCRGTAGIPEGRMLAMRVFVR